MTIVYLNTWKNVQNKIIFVDGGEIIIYALEISHLIFHLIYMKIEFSIYTLITLCKWYAKLLCIFRFEWNLPKV